MAEEEKK